jgi:predicted AlkP superfamily pyrophosphatase or phosphodiesterase
MRFLAFLTCLAGAWLSAQDLPVIKVPHAPNTPVQQAKHYVILVSFDGYRYDYAKKYGGANLLALGQRGATAPDGMIPSYPSVTFPNHYTIVTGLYPEHHGIVAMSFYDPARKQSYAFNNPATDADGTWYGGTPLWVLAEKQGMRTACLFWPGSEAEIQGMRPSYYLKFDDKIPGEKRVDQVLSWLRLPTEERPHFITLYFSEVDHAGHIFGPETDQVHEAVQHLDQFLGQLENGLSQLALPVDVIVVSDHGMETEQGPWINLDQYADLAGFETSGSLLYAPSEQAAAKAYDSLRNASEKFHVYRRAEMPLRLHYDANPREGDPIIVPTGPYAIRALARTGTADRPPNKGVHGYDAETMQSMRAIFFAAGPDIRSGVIVEPFKNVGVFPLVETLLGLEQIPVDGSIGSLSGILVPPEKGAPEKGPAEKAAP